MQRPLAMRLRACGDRVARRMSAPRLKIGVSARILHPQPGAGPGFVLGVQWHPEFHAPGDGYVLDCAPILDEFLRAA